MAKAKKEEKATAVESYEGTKEAPRMQVVAIPISTIDVIEGFNVRQTDADKPDGEGAREPYTAGGERSPVIGVGSMGTSMDTLTADIKRNGLLQPILVRPVGTRYAVVSGHRRFAACKTLEWKTIDCVVRNLSDEEAYIINLTENIQREDLSPGEIADRAIVLRARFPESFAPGKDGNSEKLAKLLGVNKGYMNNLIRLAEKLHPSIWKVCRNGRNPNAPPHHKLHKWIALDDHDEQWAAYQDWLGAKPADKKADEGTGGTNADGKTESEKKHPEFRRPSHQALLDLDQTIVALAKEKKMDEREKSIALAVLRYCIGKTDAKGNPPAPPYAQARVSTTESKSKN